MPSYIIKLNKEEDLYVYWSEIVDAPHYWGTRAELSEYMIRIGHADDLENRFDRAEENGTSAFAYAENYGWDDKGVLIYDQKGFLYRNELKEFLGSLDEEMSQKGRHVFDVSLLHPFEDDHEEE